MRSTLVVDLDREQSSAAMWHALRASTFAGRNRVEIDAGVVHALLNARYHSSDRGQFISEDPSFLSLGDPTAVKQVTGLDQRAFLADPQLANSYNYGRDNPITMKDPQGNFAFLLAALPYIYAAYTGAQFGVDTYDAYNMNVVYRDTPTGRQERGATNVKLGLDLVAGATGEGLNRAGYRAASVALNPLFIGKDGADTLTDNPIYGYLQPKYANSSLSKAQLPIMNAGNYGVGVSNIFSSSIQARREVATNFNRSSGYSGSGGSAPSSNSIWVTPSGAVVTFGGQLVAPPPQIISSKK